MIPKVINQIWLGPIDVETSKLQQNLKKSLDVSVYKLWTDAEASRITGPYFDGVLTDTELWNASTSYAMKSDLLRYLILEKWGGWYIDSDFIMKRDIGQIFCGSSLTVAAESMWYTNSIIGASKKNEFLESLNSEIWHKRKSLEMISRNQSILEITGPIIFTKILTMGDWHLHPSTRIIPPSFYAMQPGYDIKWMRQVRPELLDKEGYPIGSIGRHLYSASWKDNGNRNFRRDNYNDDDRRQQRDFNG
jgi:mannosyltransferase OCH1-like enzyme